MSPPPMPLVSWSDLPEELWELIFTHAADTLVLYKCTKVCRLWRSVVKKLLASLPPLLVLHTKLNPFDNIELDRVNLFNIFSSNSIDCEIPKFKTRGGRSYVPKSVSTSKGCLIVNYTTFKCDFGSTKNHSQEIYLYNPLSRVGIWLPSLSCPDNIPEFVLSAKPTDPNCMVLALNEFGRNLKFCQPGDEKWTTGFLNNNIKPTDIIQYKGEFYTIDASETFSQLEFTPYLRAKAIPIKLKNKSVSLNYLVESSSGELLMVCRILQNFACKSRKFKVYKLNWEKGEWDKITNLGDEAIFLASNDSICVKAGGSTGCKPNCIYFTIDSWISYMCFPRYSKEFGIYDLGKKTMNRAPQSFPRQENPYHRWFKPDI